MNEKMNINMATRQSSKGMIKTDGKSIEAFVPEQTEEQKCEKEWKYQRN